MWLFYAPSFLNMMSSLLIILLGIKFGACVIVCYLFLFYDTFIINNFVIIISYYSFLSLQFHFYLITIILSDLSGGVLN